MHEYQPPKKRVTLSNSGLITATTQTPNHTPLYASLTYPNTGINNFSSVSSYHRESVSWSLWSLDGAVLEAVSIMSDRDERASIRHTAPQLPQVLPPPSMAALHLGQVLSW
ncbi:hypothetical protein FOCG_05598 [Fusarium oxysporum f. sp. radicis-lycopersici 26381]|nr:hypothetical protein FOCG_05598 [Fusarium oxysporum f. sp. radicis-lycopersici 26381]